MIIFIWKVSMGMVKGYDIKFEFNARRGWLAIPKQVRKDAPAAVRRARADSIQIRGVKLFNLLTVGLRNMASDHQDMFKSNLDTWHQ